MARIILVDDEPLLTDSLEIILNIQGGHEVVGKAQNGVAALEMLRTSCADLMLVEGSNS